MSFAPPAAASLPASRTCTTRSSSSSTCSGVYRPPPSRHRELGKWSIRYTEHEYCRILEGLSLITAADGQAVTVRPGDEFVIPRGFVGTWEVLQPTRKRFVMHELVA